VVDVGSDLYQPWRRQSLIALHLIQIKPHGLGPEQRADRLRKQLDADVRWLTPW
jgi:hypothetical protein